jgi:hypothetical protein
MAKITTVVFIDLNTKRILGFAPEGATPYFPPGTRYETKTPFDSMELEKFVKRFHEEGKRDVEEKTMRQVMREAPIRKAIRDALIARSQHLDPLNRDLNYAILGIMDQRYRATMDAKTKYETFLLAQAYDESKAGEDVALEHPMFHEAKVN